MTPEYNDRQLALLLKNDPAQGLARAVDRYGGAVKTICAAILGGDDPREVEGVEAAYPGASVRSDRILLKLLDQSGERVLPSLSTYSRGEGGGWELLLSFDSAIRPEDLTSLDVDGVSVPLTKQ